MKKFWTYSLYLFYLSWHVSIMKYTVKLHGIIIISTNTYSIYKAP